MTRRIVPTAAVIMGLLATTAAPARMRWSIAITSACRRAAVGGRGSHWAPAPRVGGRTREAPYEEVSMPHRLPLPPPLLRAALLAARTGALPLVVLAGLWTPAYDGGGDSFAATGDLPGNAQHLIDRHECSTTGFDA